MHAPYGTKVAKALQRHYFEQVPTDTVKEVYGVKSWPGDDAGFAWSAPWWAGLDRLQPGSAAGSHAQESWHRWQLKAHIHNLYHTVRAFMDSLGAFCCDAISNMKDAKETLPDLPQEPWPDRVLLSDVGKLLTRGRSPASEYQRLKRFSKWVSSTGDTTYYAMRRNLLLWNGARGAWEAERSPPEVPTAVAKHMALLFHADGRVALDAALVALGAAAPVWSDFNGLLRILNRYVLVIHGESATKLWRMEGQSGPSPPTSQAVCVFCQVACLNAVCEHMYVAFFDGRPDWLDVAEHPARKGQHRRPDDATLLSPQGPRLAAQSAAAAVYGLVDK